VVVALLILSVAVYAMIEAYSPGILSSGGEEEAAVFAGRCRGTLNRVAALDFKTLSDLAGGGNANPVNLDTLFGSGQETFSYRGSTYTPTVVITSRGGAWGGLLEITAALKGIQFKTLKANH